MTQHSNLTNGEITILARLGNLGRKLDALTLAAQGNQPNYRHPLNAYFSFDWSSIGATVMKEDDQGSTEVLWNNYLWTRRYGDGKFGRAIWFSRGDGRDDEGNPKYARLITFKDTADAEPISTSIQP